MSGYTKPKTKDGRRKAFIKRLHQLQSEAARNNVEFKEVIPILLQKGKSVTTSKDKKNASKTSDNKRNGRLQKVLIFIAMLIIIYAVIVSNLLKLESLDHFKSNVLPETPCLLKSYHYSRETFRPLVDCDMCRGMTEVAVERNISVEDFREKYAYTSRPVLIKDAIRDWTALEVFSFKFFKDLYENTEGAFMYRSGGCLSFMPYATEFNSLDEVFKMDEERAKCKEGFKPWYVGWMNCKKGIQEAIRQHYKRPYFLPNDTESSIVNWVFMGGPGPGVPIHIDVLVRPSWQAQISGRKTWTLVPVPECESSCHTVNVTVEKGDIVVLNVNHWFHTTYVHPGEISIAVGSEYD